MIHPMTVIAKMSFYSVASMLFTLLFWPFVIPGIVLSFFCGKRCEIWAVAVVALAIIVGCHAISGDWMVRIGGKSDDGWLVEISRFILSWAIGTIFVGAGFKVPRLFREGLDSTRKPLPEQDTPSAP